MYIDKKVLLISLLYFFANISISFAMGANENPNEISDYYKEQIEIGRIKPLSVLEVMDKEKYDLVISLIPENNIEDYYFSISIIVIIDDKTKKHFSLEEYNENKYLPEYINCEIDYIDYAIWYYEAFFNKYRGTVGNATGKCFSLIFDGDYKFREKYYWK